MPRQETLTGPPDCLALDGCPLSEFFAVRRARVSSGAKALSEIMRGSRVPPRAPFPQDDL